MSPGSISTVDAGDDANRATRRAKRARNDTEKYNPIYGEDEIPEVDAAFDVGSSVGGHASKRKHKHKKSSKSGSVVLDSASVAAANDGDGEGGGGAGDTVTMREVQQRRRGGLANRTCHCCDAQLGNTTIDFKDERRAQMNRMYVDLRDKMPAPALAQFISAFFNTQVRHFTIMNGGDLPEWTAAMVEDHIRNCFMDPVMMAIQDVREWHAVSQQLGDAIFERTPEGKLKCSMKNLQAKQLADKMKYGILRHTRTVT